MKIPPANNIEQPQEMAKRLLSQMINLANLQKLSVNNSYFNSATRQTEYDSPGLASDQPVPSTQQRPKTAVSMSHFAPQQVQKAQQPQQSAPAWDVLAKLCESDDDQFDSPQRNTEDDDLSPQQRQRGFKRGNYARIPDETRAKLIKMVVEDGIGVVKATARLNIKYTTGKHIVRRYMRTGQFCDKRFKHVATRYNAEKAAATKQEPILAKPLVVSLPTDNASNLPSLKNVRGAVAEWMAKNQASQPNASKPVELFPHAANKWPQQAAGELINPVSVSQAVPQSQYQPQDRFTSPMQLVGQQPLKIHTINVNGKQMRFVQLDQ